MKKVIFGTGNPGKINTMREYLKGLNLNITYLKDYAYDWPEPEETGRLPIENARQKAKAYYRVCRSPVFSCDSGLFIEGLAEEEQPGVHVRVINGKRLTDYEMRIHYSKIAARLGGRCLARYRNAICMVVNDTLSFEYDGEDIWGKPFYLMDHGPEQVEEGYPLDPISVDIDTGKYFTLLTEEETDMNRGQAYRRFFMDALLSEQDKREKIEC